MQEFDPITGAPITPMNNAAMLAGGSKPMTAMDNPYQTGQANMNPNFIGNYSGPTTGMVAQEKKYLAEARPLKPAKTKDYLLTGVTVDAEVNTKNPMNVIGPNKDLANFKPTTVKPDSENPGIEGEQSPKSVVLNYNEVNDAKLDERKRNSKPQYGAQANRDESFRNTLKKRSAALGVPDPVDSILNQDKVEDKMREERRRESIINTDFGDKAEVIKGVSYTPNSNPEKNYEKGFEPFGSLSGQAKSISSRKINGATVLGGNQPTKQSGLGAVVQQNKKMPTGPEGKGIRGLATSVQENMGYDPLSQERLTQSRRGTKCMRVKRK